MSADTVSRRALLKAGSAVAVATAFGLVPTFAGPSGPTHAAASTPRRAALRLPRVLPANAGVRLSAGPAAPGVFAPDALGYDSGSGGEVPGPVLEARAGGDVHVVLANDLADPTTLHSHGAVVPHETDGHPAGPVAPGESRTYRYPVRQRAGLLWLHPHPHRRVASQVYRGLAGFLVVRDDAERALRLPAGARELFIALRDASFDRSRLRGQGAPGRLVCNGFLGDTPVANGVANASVEVETALYRLRLLNASNARPFRLALATSASGSAPPLTLIGSDGGLLPAPAVVPSVEFGPAERLDVLLDLRSVRVGDRVALRCERAGWDVVVFEVARSADDPSAVPTALPAIAPLVRPNEGPPERTFQFQGNHGINGGMYRLGEVRERVPFGQTERWRFEARSRLGFGGLHAAHVHGTQFQVVAREGRTGRTAVLPHERGWKDTVLLFDGEAAEVLVRFDTYRGPSLVHCHKLEHEDCGMMLGFVVE